VTATLGLGLSGGYFRVRLFQFFACFQVIFSICESGCVVLICNLCFLPGVGFVLLLLTCFRSS
jgi:hypothetical protein